MKNGRWAKAHFILLFSFLVAMLMVVGCGERPKPPPPLPECDDDQDCPESSNCVGGQCIRIASPPPPECASNADCSDNKICVGDKCKYECTSDADCGQGMACENNRCEESCKVQRVLFNFDESYLTGEAQSLLRANAECIKKSSFARLTIEGHCDERGSIDYNLSLGQRRSKAVLDFLVDLGVVRSKVKNISYGEERPLDYGHDEDSWAKNRRSEMIVE